MLQAIPAGMGCCRSRFDSLDRLFSFNEYIDVFDQHLVKALRCPQNQSTLTLASKELVEQINRGISEGRVFSIGGHRLERSLDAGLVREDGDLLYPVIDAIPVMLPDEALDLSKVE